MKKSVTHYLILKRKCNFVPLFVALGLLAGLLEARAQDPDFWSWAQTPPMGWNSWDGFATTVTEAQTRAQADFMAANLHKHGWEYIVVDIQWYEPQVNGFNYRKDAKLEMDTWGRLVPEDWWRFNFSEKSFEILRWMPHSVAAATPG